MKKFLALVLALALVATFAACGAKDTTSSGDNAPAGDAAAPAEYKLGVGTVVSLDSSAEGTAQADTTVATVVLDKDGKIVDCDFVRTYRNPQKFSDVPINITDEQILKDIKSENK